MKIFEREEKYKIMVLKHKNILGIVFSGNSVAVSEIEQHQNSYRQVRCGEYTFEGSGDILTLAQDPDFKNFLKEKKFKSNRAVVGISAKNSLSTFVEIPPLKDKSALGGIVRINLEKQSLLNSENTLIDCSGHVNNSHGNVLVVSVLKKHIESIKEMFSSVGIIPVSFTLNCVALNANKDIDTVCNVILFPDSAEMAVLKNRCVKTIRYISLKSEDRIVSTSKLKMEFRNTILPSLNGDTNCPVYVWDYSGDNQSIVGHIAEDFKEFNFIKYEEDEKQQTSMCLCDLATRLARNSLIKPLAIDFLNSRLVDPKENKYRKLLPRAAFFAALLLLTAAVLAWDWHNDKQTIKKMQADIALIAPSVKNAEKMIERVNFAKPWFVKEPKFLQALKELTLMFPEHGDIWLTSLVTDESFNVIMTGKANSEKDVYNVLDNLKLNNNFHNIEVDYVRETGKNTSGVSFSIKFQYMKKG